MRKEHGLMALQLGLMFSTQRFGSFANDNDFVVEKSGLPKKGKFPLTDEESEILSGLNGKLKKEYLTQLREKYEN